MSDLRTIKTINTIQNAFMELLEIKGFAKIKITDIADKALINRNTIYLHYGSKEEIAISLLKKTGNVYDLGERLIKIFRSNCDPILVREYFQSLVDTMSTNIELYRLFMTDPNLNGYLNKEVFKLKEKIATYLKQTSSNQIRLDYIVSGSFGIISRWIIFANASKETIIKELTNITVLNLSRLEVNS